ncbi:MAG: response regulator [Candidatus Pacearchaeota archaeon]|jgi:CheY-like chemotaxis protein
MKILIGDDDSIIISSYRILLKGIEIDETSDSKGLVEKVRQSNYDLVITDNDYEDGIESGGIEAIRQIRQFNQTTPILLQSGELNEEKRKRALEAGVTYVLEKGKVSELMKIITLTERGHRENDK